MALPAVEGRRQAAFCGARRTRIRRREAGGAMLHLERDFIPETVRHSRHARGLCVATTRSSHPRMERSDLRFLPEQPEAQSRHCRLTVCSPRLATSPMSPAWQAGDIRAVLMLELKQLRPGPQCFTRCPRHTQALSISLACSKAITSAPWNTAEIFQ